MNFSEISLNIQMHTFRKTCDSIAATRPKAQHDPHRPWSLTGVIAPAIRQSRLGGRSERLYLFLSNGKPLLSISLF
jgi:hypothetical protein